MKIEMYIYLNPDQLSSYKTNIIEPRLTKGGPPIGQVESVIGELENNTFKCVVSVYHKMETIVLKALSDEVKKLSG